MLDRSVASLLGRSTARCLSCASTFLDGSHVLLIINVTSESLVIRIVTSAARVAC